MTFHSICIALVIRSGIEGCAASTEDDPARSTDDRTAEPDPGYWWSVLQPDFGELILVSPEPRSHLAWQGLIVRGTCSPLAPLPAVRTALTVAQNPQLLMFDPHGFLSPAGITRVAALAEPRWDVLAVAPKTGQSPVPIVFHQRCLKSIDRHLAMKSGGLQNFYRHVRVHTLAMDDLT